MTKTVTCLYQDQEKAAAIVDRLELAGVARGGIDVYPNYSDDLIDDLEDAGVPRSDAHAYAEGVRRGGVLVSVGCDDDDVDRVTDILDDEGVLDLDEQQTSWRSEGWQGHDVSASGVTAGPDAATAAAVSDLAESGGMGRTAGGRGEVTGSPDVARAATDRTDMSDRDEVIPVVEEELHVGKRDVGGGRVRIHSRVVERPVQEQVNLREERVHVERRPVDRPLSEADAAFRDRTIEAEERREEAVVSKEARVTEELVVRKDVEERTETVSDTVRRTEVDVEDERNIQGTGTPGSTDRKV
jgi:uncharacterized protein (TIGR02271 family)